MIKKETFCKIIESLQEFDNVCHTFSVFVNLDRMEEFFQVHDSIIEALEEEFDVQDEEHNPIYHYIYESKFGITNTEVYDTTTNEVVTNLNTPEALYDYLLGRE